MQWTDLGNPHPKTESESYQPIAWESLAESPLPEESPLSARARSFADIALSRRTRREFAALSLEQLGSLLTLTCRTQHRTRSELGFSLSRAPCPSAGAIHPIHVLLIQPNDKNWYRYAPHTHTLHQIPSTVDAASVMASMHDIVPASAATLLLFAAEPGMTASKYEAPESLVWRDAGVQLGFFAMAAEALDLNFCPLGVTGEPWIGRLIDQTGLAGVGAALLGSRPY